MFDELGKKLDGALKKLRQRGVLTEPMIKEGLREVRRVLPEADVNFRVTRDFLARVQERALGEAVLKAVSPGQQIVKIVHDELAHLLGEGRPTLATAAEDPTVILLVGLQGSGKTTSAAKLARRLGREGKTPMLAACDLQRPAAIEQLQALGNEIGAPVVAGEFGGDPVAAAAAAVEKASFTEAAAGVLLFVGSMASISARIAVGAITDRIGGRGFAGVAILLGTGALVFLLLRPTTGLAFGVLVVVAFATAWGWTGLMTFTVVNANTSTVAASSAIMQAGIFLGAGLGPILLGWTIDRYSFSTSWVAVAVLLLTAASIVTLVGMRTRQSASLRA